MSLPSSSRCLLDAVRLDVGRPPPLPPSSSSSSLAFSLPSSLSPSLPPSPPPPPSLSLFGLSLARSVGERRLFRSLAIPPPPSPPPPPLLRPLPSPPRVRTIPVPLLGTILLFPLLLRSTCRAREFGALGALDEGK